MPLIDHGLGLYTLYGHCSSVLVQKGQKVKRGQIIAKTGVSGLALGDHVHFGVLVQGIEVHPLEWMSKSWLKTHINDVFKKADRILGYN
jgi:murein DD-endopeptidase MepM/ murein hydrolase activator NlpD